MLVAVHPPEPSSELAEALLLAGVETIPVADQPQADDWTVAVFDLIDEPAAGLRMARGLVEDLGVSVLVVLDRNQTGLLKDATFVADFVIGPPDPIELRTRLARLVRGEPTGEVIGFKDLELNTATYQATVIGRPVDLTYMEYELLRFFIGNQGRVWSREQLLSKVWGYDYFGGARTVDVHVRRLRSKLGEERASWITTVRSVGYRFG
ncbi:MAG: response regulator transcription factor [Acidimicrobiia bacterium]|nr:response regulator transcription factor [Acidimicrobiia bacterium]MDH3396744.1 response regulator transcription factor [Acidimicrobiia bacterium]